jgi:integrase
VLAFTGMRRGEALALRWHDYRDSSALVSVRRSFGFADNRLYMSMPKSAHARVLELDGETVRWLRRHRTKTRNERTRSGLPALSSEDFIFTNADGEPYHPNGISKVFKQLTAKANVPAIRLHDLRHTHASHLIESGANPKVVQERLGHADVVITLNIYSHLFPTTQRNAVDRLTEFYEEM